MIAELHLFAQGRKATPFTTQALPMKQPLMESMFFALFLYVSFAVTRNKTKIVLISVNL